MTIATTDAVREEARRLALRAAMSPEEAEQVLSTYGLHIDALREEESYD